MTPQKSDKKVTKKLKKFKPFDKDASKVQQKIDKLARGNGILCSFYDYMKLEVHQNVELTVNM